jgi:hypothetical protein
MKEVHTADISTHRSEKKNACTVVVRKCEERNHMEDLSSDKKQRSNGEKLFLLLQ